MKRLVCIALSLLFIFCVCGCEDKTEQEISNCISTIVDNTDNRDFSSANDYINASRESYDKLLSYGDKAIDFMVRELKSSKGTQLREVIMLTACTELTGVGKTESYKDKDEWLKLYEEHLSSVDK